MAFESMRPEEGKRTFVSAAVEEAIAETAGRIGDRELAWLFTNCFPNTLDTTVTFAREADGSPDTFVITGDIAAMWLRDSTNQVWPYLPLVGRDEKLREMFRGLIFRQCKCVRIDPYANAFYRTPTEVGHWKSDHTEMRPGVHERKYELDSLCAVMRLIAGYVGETGDKTVFTADVLSALRLIVETIRNEQAGTEEFYLPKYVFQRTTSIATDTLPVEGFGNPYRRCGMARSAFRPSDDASIYQFLVPANAMAVVTLRAVAGCVEGATGGAEIASAMRGLAGEIDAGIRSQGVVTHPAFGEIFAFEVDGYGSRSLMDDANVPSLLALPYLGYCPPTDAVYQSTRRFVLSDANPYFSRGTAGVGISGPHVGRGWIWPMAVTMQALTATDDAEIAGCLRILKGTHAGSGFMHESFWKDDAGRFTRKWFAWANTLFGELVMKVVRERPALLKAALQVA